MEENDIAKILDLDRKLRKELAEAEKNRDEIDGSIDAKVSALHDQYHARMDEYLAGYAKEKTEKTEKRIAAQNAEYQKQLDAIDSKYKSDRKKWLDHIVGAVTEV